MPGYNGSGTYQRFRSWEADAAAGVKIRADYHDDEDDGFAAGLSNAICRDGQSTITANIPFNAKKITNLGAPVDPTDAATKAYADTKLSLAGGTLTGPITAPMGTSLAVIQRTVRTSSQTINLHADTRAFLIEVIGGGGGGASSGASAANAGAAGGGGGGGGYAAKMITRTAGMTPACTIGAGGVSGAVGNNSTYTDGTNTLTANGGGAGVVGVATGNGTSAGGYGGAGSGGDMNVAGDSGDPSLVICLGAGFNVQARGGYGGSSHYGTGGIGGVVMQNTAANQAGIAAAIGYGGGGGGAATGNGGGVPGGGGGAQGCVIVTEYR